ncbi:MAG: hypothetical protein NVS9B13_08530 [Candidatus Acidiferrum sp.]
MLKSISILLTLCLISAICPMPTYAASRGVVIKRISGCDYFMVNATGGYAVLECYGGHDPDSGDLLIGNFETYGMHDILDDTADETLTVWTEDYDLSRTRALEILLDKCGD